MTETHYLLLADAMDDVGFFEPDPFALDPEIAGLCDEATLWLSMAGTIAHALGLTLPQGIGAMLRSQSRVYSGYMPEAQRRAVRHRKYRDGVTVRPVGRSKVRPAGAGRKAIAATVIDCDVVSVGEAVA